MNFTTLLKIGENLTDNSTFSERAIVGAQVIAIGMGVVFGVLILLIAILQVFKLFGTKKPTDSKAPQANASAPVSTPAASAAPASEDEAVVAVVSAAIAASRGESECNFNIISIKKIVK